VGWAPTWDEAQPLLDGRVVAYLVDGRVAQLAIIDSALPVDEARSLVASHPALEEVQALVNS
jgi:hypothetical protein